MASVMSSRYSDSDNGHGQADDLRRVPVGHDAEDRAAAVQKGMRPAQQLDLARDVGERVADLNVGDHALALHRELADLQKIQLAVAVDREFHVDGVAAEGALELGHERNHRGKRGRTGVGARAKAEEGLEIVAGAGGDHVGAAGAIVVVHHIVGASAARQAREGDARHRDALEHGLHENLVVRAGGRAKRGDDFPDRLNQPFLAEHAEHRIVFPRLRTDRAILALRARAHDHGRRAPALGLDRGEHTRTIRAPFPDREADLRQHPRGSQARRERLERLRLGRESHRTGRCLAQRVRRPDAFGPDALDRGRAVERAEIVEDEVGSLRKLGGHVEPDHVAELAALRGSVNPLGVPALQLVHRHAQVDFAVVRNVLAIPALHVVKHRDGRADHIAALAREHAAEARIAHRGLAPVGEVVPQVLGDHLAQHVAVEENGGTAGGTQPLPELAAERRLAGARQSGDPVHASRGNPRFFR